MPPFLAYLAPVFIVFEVWQLVIAERYLGLKQIQAGVDPRTLGPREPVAAAWSLALVAYWIWLGLMLIIAFGRTQIVCMLIVCILGYALRRNSTLKWVLVILTLEGAVRIGMLVSYCALIVRLR